MKIKGILHMVFFTGLVMGILAATAQAFMRLQPPAAYGICFIGHPRDLSVLFINTIAGTDWPALELFAVYPALTVIGVFIGSYVAAYRKGLVCFGVHVQ